MPFKSLFEPISQEAFNAYASSHGITEVNEDAVAQPVQQDTTQQVAQQPAPQVQPQPAQPQQQVQGQGQAPGAISIPLDVVKQLGATIQTNAAGYTKDPSAQASLAIWKTFTTQPTLTNLVAYIGEFAKYVGAKMQGAAQQPTPQPQGQPNAQQPTGQPAQGQVGAVNASAKPDLKFIDPYAKARAAAKKMMLKEGEDIKTAGNDKFLNGSKEGEPSTDVKYGQDYGKETPSTPKGDTTIENSEKAMHDSIFGDLKDFIDGKDVKYGSEYELKVDKPKERDQHVELTKAEPFEPGVPKLKGMDNPSSVSSTVFTLGKPAESPAGTTNPLGSSKNRDEGSSEANESFDTDFNTHDFLSEGLSPKLKDTIVQEYLNDHDGEFDLEEFSAWVKQNYPIISRDPSSFDEIAGKASSSRMTEDDEIAKGEEIDDDGIDLDAQSEIEPDGSEDDTDELDDLQQVADEYMDDMDPDIYDEDEILDWLEDNYERVVENQSILDEFLDLVREMIEEKEDGD